jgi:RNA polymerase sigma-70 factor (ECF subfamily)
MNFFITSVADLKSGNLKAFESVFDSLSTKLERFAFEYVANKEDASDIVQSVFMTLWERKESLTDDTRIFNYLITLTKNQCLNYLKHVKAQRNYQQRKETADRELMLNYYALERFDENKLILEELSTTIEKAIDSLPGQCREIFMMSRFEGLKYQEIADKLNISVKTVEKKMSISLSIMRSVLKDYYCLLFFFTL